MMSVKTRDKGCDQCGVFLFNSALKFGYRGPTTLSLSAPPAASRWRSDTASRSIASSGHVACAFRGEGTNCFEDGLGAECGVGDTPFVGFECGLLFSSMNSTPSRSSL